MVLHNFSLLIHKLMPTSPFLKERSLSCIGPHYNWRITGIQELFIHSVDKDILNQNQKMANCISTASRNITTKNNVCGPQKRFLLCSFIKTLDYSIVLTLLDDVSWLYFVFFDSLSCALHNDVMSAIKGWCSRTISQPFWCKNFFSSKSSFFFS